MASAAAGAVTIASARADAAADKFRYLEATVADLQARMSSGRVAARTLAGAYLARIDAHDRRGVRLNSIIELNPEALTIAGACDRERKAGRVRGPLHGIPVLIKDNIATADRMQTTAGSLALMGAKAPRDAFLVRKLRDAGAVILGKTNLSEWANFRSPRSTSGWSSRGGLTRNPYALDRNPSGSSSGSAVAVAANLAALAVGTETDGSIVSPASVNGIVGLKPTVGLVSRDGVVPLAPSFDTPGPMTRTVADAAALLTVMAGPDPRDAATQTAPQVDYVAALARESMHGLRIGVARNGMSNHPDVNALFETALGVLREQGATIVDQLEVPNVDRLRNAELTVLLHEFKAAAEGYLAEFGRGAPVANLSDIIAFNQRHARRVLRYFGQEFFERAQGLGGLDSGAYREALATCRRYARDEGLDVVFRDAQVEVLVFPTGGLAWLTDLVNGRGSAGGFSAPAAVAGYPHLTVPMGFVRRLPAGLSFVGPAWSEARLLACGHAFEQARHARRAPAFARSVALD
jgi:amidase